MAKKTVKKTKDVEVVEVKKKPTLTKVKCIHQFYDIEAGIVRTPGEATDTWEITPERLVALRDAEKAQNVTLIEVL